MTKRAILWCAAAAIVGCGGGGADPVAGDVAMGRTSSALGSSSWPNVPPKVDLLVVTSEALAPSLMPFVAHKQTLGISAYVVTVTTLLGEGGVDAPEAIKRGILDAWKNLGTRSVMLAGSPAHVPVRRRFVSGNGPVLDGTYNPSDLYYSNLFKHNSSGVPLLESVSSPTFQVDMWDDNHDGFYNEEKWPVDTIEYNPDHVDGYPDIALGRVPAATAAEMTEFVNKVIAYEHAPRLPGVRPMSLFADGGYPGSTDESNLIETSLTSARNAHYGMRFTSTPPAPFVAGGAAAVAEAAKNSVFITYVGHGSSEGWAGGFEHADAQSLLTNTGRFPIVMASACETGKFATWTYYNSGTPNPYEGQHSFASDWLFAPNGAGSVAYFGESLVLPNNWGAALFRYAIDAYADGERSLGQIWLKAQRAYWHAYRTNGDVLGAPRIFLGTMSFFGDPTMRAASIPTARADYDGDNKTDISVWRPTAGAYAGWWFLDKSGSPESRFKYGEPGDVPVLGDFDGDGINDVAVWRPTSGAWTGWWFILKSSGGEIRTSLGWTGDIPAPADFDGDGKTDLAIFRPSTGTWYWIASSTGALRSKQYGVSGDVPVPADYDADGKADIAVWRPTAGTWGGWWFILNSASPERRLKYGEPGDIPVPADYDGDGKADVAVWRPTAGAYAGWWFIRNSTAPENRVKYGTTGDVPVPGDYDGDGRTDFAVWRPSVGEWFFYTTETAKNPVYYGVSGDVPAPRTIMP